MSVADFTCRGGGDDVVAEFMRRLPSLACFVGALPKYHAAVANVFGRVQHAAGNFILNGVLLSVSELLTTVLSFAPVALALKS